MYVPSRYQRSPHGPVGIPVSSQEEPGLPRSPKWLFGALEAPRGAQNRFLGLLWAAQTYTAHKALDSIFRAWIPFKGLVWCTGLGCLEYPKEISRGFPPKNL